MDGITLAASLHEINRELAGMRLEKVQQPERDTLFLTFRGSKRVLISSNPGSARIQLTEAAPDNPAQPPMFCMLLRKLLQGGIFMEAEQPGFDRIAHLRFSARDELGDKAIYTLVVEIMGKHSNIILTRQDGTIVDSILRVTPAMSSVRCVLPGMEYQAPPSQGKSNPIDADGESIMEALTGMQGRLGKEISQAWSGISPTYGREIAGKVASLDVSCDALNEEDRRRIADGLNAVFASFRAGEFQPTLVRDSSGKAIGCFPFVPNDYDAEFKQSFDSMGAALDAFYQSRETSTRFQQMQSQLQRVLQNNVERCRKKMAIQRDILSNEADMEKQRLYGELLTANAHAIPRGESMVELLNYYDPDGGMVRVPLDPRMGPQENAQRYFKKYGKQKAAVALADEQLQQIGAELNYLEGQQDNLDKCSTLDELREMRDELIGQSYIRPERAAKKQIQRRKESQPMHFQSSTGREILVGKNNAQNDRLTIRQAKPNEMWLHVKDTPGSHVLILGEEEPDDDTLVEAAMLAAHYSKARNGSQVTVDYTPRRFIKKPNGSVPGYVIYHKNYSMYVTPSEEALAKIRRIDSEN